MSPIVHKASNKLEFCVMSKEDALCRRRTSGGIKLISTMNRLEDMANTQGGNVAALVQGAKATFSDWSKLGRETNLHFTQALANASDAQVELWERRVKALRPFFDKYPHLRDRLESDQQWLMMSNIGAFWDDLNARVESEDVAGVEKLLDANPLRTGTELRQSLDITLSHSKNLRKGMADLTADLKRRKLRLEQVQSRFKQLEVDERKKIENEVGDFERDVKILDMLRFEARLALVESSTFAIWDNWTGSR